MITHYLDPKMGQIIVEALRLYGDRFIIDTPTEDEQRLARDWADAMENDTYMLWTSTPPDEAPDA